MKRGICGFLVLLLAVSVSAQNFQDYNIKFVPVDEGIEESITLTFIPNIEINSISYDLEQSMNKVFASSGENSDFEVKDNTITIKDSFKPSEAKKINIKFITEDLVQNIGKTNVFSFKFHPPESLDLKVDFLLPKSYSISEIDPAISPTPDSITTDGREILVTWEFQDLNDSVNFILLYERENSSTILLFIIILLVIILLVFFILLGKKQHKSQKILKGTLSHDEKKIIEFLAEDESRTQKDIVILTGFSKAKISKLVRRLEERGVIEKKPHMTTNKLFLNKEFKK